MLLLAGDQHVVLSCCHSAGRKMHHKVQLRFIICSHKMNRMLIFMLLFVHIGFLWIFPTVSAASVEYLSMRDTRILKWWTNCKKPSQRQQKTTNVYMMNHTFNKICVNQRRQSHYWYGRHRGVILLGAPQFMQQKPASDAFFVVEVTLSVRPQVADLRLGRGWQLPRGFK